MPAQPYQTADMRAPGVTINVYSVRNFLFLCAIVLMNYTMSRPSPVDVVFLCALAASFMLNQRLSLNFFVYFFIISTWALSFWIASVNLMDTERVMFELIAKSFAVVISLIACYVALSWNEANYHRFFKVYIFSACIAAVLGVAGFVTNNELFTWDGRSKGLFDDPNMYGGFLIPAILGTLYLLFNGGRRLLCLGVLLLLLIGILFAFSRAAIGSLTITGALFLVFTFRRNLVKAGLYAFVIGCVLVLMGVLAIALVDNFADKLFERLTVAKEYDSGHFGRYNRYLLSIPFILDHPLGMGIGEIDKYFPEPIHNIFISSFLNYGWIAGSAWLLLIALSVRHAWVNYRETQHPLAVLLLCCSFSQVLCAVLHQCEQWRSLWLFMGLHWGFTIRNFVPASVPARPAVLRPAHMAAATPA